LQNVQGYFIDLQSSIVKGKFIKISDQK